MYNLQQQSVVAVYTMYHGTMNHARMYGTRYLANSVSFPFHGHGLAVGCKLQVQVFARSLSQPRLCACYLTLRLTHFGVTALTSTASGLAR